MSATLEPEPTHGPPTFAAHVAACWDAALDVWGVSITLSPPVAWEKGDEGHWGGDEPLAFIDMVQRQVVVNFGLLHGIGALDSLPAVLAHEIGHHVRFPHTLGLAAELELIQRRLLPTWPHSLGNLFFDLLVNEWVGRTWAEQLQAVYRGFSARSGPPSPLFAFYLGVYEELWGLDRKSLGPGAPGMGDRYPAWRADARMFAQTFWALPDIHLQFVYFCSVFARYLPDEEPEAFPLSGDLPDPDADDFDNAVSSGNVRRAIEEGVDRGWVDEAAAGEPDPMADINRAVAGRPGDQQGAFRQALVSKHYKRLVDRHLIDVPTLDDQPEPEPLIPSTTEDWEWGDNPASIDWTASVLAGGPLAAAMPLKRTLLPVDPDPTGTAVPSFEIYLDTSGSMPSPMVGSNAMTLAAQVLAAAVIRKGGKVRAIVYSSGPPLISDWMYGEEKAREFLFNYQGGGTEYPFDRMLDFARERSDVIRVVVSDSDFLWNVRDTTAMDKLVSGAESSKLFVALLGLPNPDAATKPLARAIAVPTFRLVPVVDYQAFGATARDLARALLGD